MNLFTEEIKDEIKEKIINLINTENNHGLEESINNVLMLIDFP